MPFPNHIIMVASENDALRRGKVGGLSDVIRDLPPALAAQGRSVDILLPSYGFLHKENQSRKYKDVRFPFGGRIETCEVYQVEPKNPNPGIRHFVIEHGGLRGEPIYFNDPPDTPFLRDAEKFALFCSAVEDVISVRR